MTTTQDITTQKVAAQALADKLGTLVGDVDNLEKQRDSLQLQLESAVDQREALRAELADVEAQLATANAALAQKIIELDAALARIAELEGTPPPPPPPPAEAFKVTGPPGGGGPNTLMQMKNGDIRYGYDVGGGIHVPKDHPELTHPCDWGELDRHVVSLVPYLDTVLRWMGNPGHAYGAQLLDVPADKWGPKLVGSSAAAGNGQNSFGSPDGQWKFGIADSPYNRSTGALVYREPGTGDTIYGEFGYAPPGSGVTVVSSAGAERRIAGTDQWAVRNLIRETDSTCLVSVWKHTVSWGRVMSPGGFYRINWKTGTVTELIKGKSVEAACVSGSQITVVTWNDGIWQSSDGGVNWSDISGNAPKTTKWRSVDVDPVEGLVISGSNPTNGFCWARRSPSGGQWLNMSATVDARDLVTGIEWHPPSGGNDMGKSGCTLTQTKWVTWGGKRVPACIGVGVLWFVLDGKCRPLAYGGGITSNRDVAASEDGKHAIITMMDHRVQATHDDGTSWKKEASGLGGPIDFTAAGFKKDTKQFLCEGGDGSRWISQPMTAATTAMAWTSTTIDPRAHNPADSRLVVSSLDIKWEGESIDDHVRERMGDVAKVHYSGGYVWVIGHGAMRRKVA